MHERKRGVPFKTHFLPFWCTCHAYSVLYSENKLYDGCFFYLKNPPPEFMDIHEVFKSCFKVSKLCRSWFKLLSKHPESWFYTIVMWETTWGGGGKNELPQKPTFRTFPRAVHFWRAPSFWDNLWSHTKLLYLTDFPDCSSFALKTHWWKWALPPLLQL